ncbi:MAG: hypothetical protein ACUVQI_07685 [Thermochromatium sp.]
MSNDLDSAERLAIPEFMEDLQSEALERREARIRLAKLEADVAYFQARLELIGAINSSHRLAQRKVFTLLYTAISRQIVALQHRLADDR